MALVIPTSVQRYFPKLIDPSQLWVNYNAIADSLTIYFTKQPVPSVWEDVDQFAYVGFAITFISAFIAHIAAGDAATVAVMPLAFLGVLLVSWFYHSKTMNQVVPV